MILPTLLSHNEYGAHVAGLTDLQQRLADANNVLASFGEIHLSAENDAEDLDASIERHEKLLEANRRGKLKAELRVKALQRELQREKMKTGELRAQAEDFLGRACADEAAKIEEELYALRDKQGATLASHRAVTNHLRDQLSQPGLPGYVSWDTGERYCKPFPTMHVAPQAVMAAVHGAGADVGASLFKATVHEPMREKASGVIARLKNYLQRS